MNPMEMTYDELLVIARRYYTAQRRLKRARAEAVEFYHDTKPVALMWAKVEGATRHEAEEADEASAQWMVVRDAIEKTGDRMLVEGGLG